MYTASPRPDTALRPLLGAGTVTVTLEGNVVQTLPLSSTVTTIGRLPENSLVLPHQSVSRHHAELRMEASGTILTDVGSAGGTLVNGTRLLPNQPYALESGSVFQIGPYTMTYVVNTPAYGMAAIEEPKAVMPAAPSHLPRPALEEPLPSVEQRATEAMPLPAARGSKYLRDLPAMFQEDDFLGRFLLIFEALWEPMEQRQDQVAMYFDPRTCPAEFLPWLAGWLNLTLNPHWPESRRRQLVAEAMDLYRWRGTAYGLRRMIEVCTGLVPAISDDPARPFVFRISVTIPPGSDVRRETIEELVRTHKPAHVGYQLEIKP